MNNSSLMKAFVSTKNNGFLASKIRPYGRLSLKKQVDVINILTTCCHHPKVKMNNDKSPFELKIFQLKNIIFVPLINSFE
jgi:hypothetical protein